MNVKQELCLFDKGCSDRKTKNLCVVRSDLNISSNMNRQYHNYHHTSNEDVPRSVFMLDCFKQPRVDVNVSLHRRHSLFPLSPLRHVLLLMAFMWKLFHGCCFFVLINSIIFCRSKSFRPKKVLANSLRLSLFCSRWFSFDSDYTVWAVPNGRVCEHTFGSLSIVQQVRKSNWHPTSKKTLATFHKHTSGLFTLLLHSHLTFVNMDSK